MSDAIPRCCPSCGHNAIAFVSGGLWDGIFDPTTRTRVGGDFLYGRCKKCGSRFAQWDGPAYVPDDDEWYREIDLPSGRAFTNQELIERLLSSSPTARLAAANKILSTFGV